MTDRCKNITLATTSLRPVIKGQVFKGLGKKNEVNLNCAKLEESRRNINDTGQKCRPPMNQIIMNLMRILETDKY